MYCTRLLASLTLVLGLASVANADFIGGDDSGPSGGDFTLLGSAWNPGPNQARFGGNPAPGSSTWSIMGAGFFDVSQFDSGHSVTMTQLITSLGVPTWGVSQYVSMINAAFNVWDAASGWTNLGQRADGNVNAGAPQASGGHLGDMRIAAWQILSPGVLAHAFQPGTEALFGAGGTIAGDIHISTSFTWRDDPTDTNADIDFDLFTVFLHEAGHALGLGHSTDPTSVMFPSYQGGRRVLTADDIAGIQAIYGPQEASGVPEPTSMALVGLVAVAGAGGAWRRRKARAA